MLAILANMVRRVKTNLISTYASVCLDIQEPIVRQVSYRFRPFSCATKSLQLRGVVVIAILAEK